MSKLLQERVDGNLTVESSDELRCGSDQFFTAFGIQQSMLKHYVQNLDSGAVILRIEQPLLDLTPFATED